MPDDWFDDAVEAESEGTAITEYDIISSPNDFNVKTIFDFIETGVVKIPPFQRNFVWDQPRASKLIESLIMGLPVPQVFLYEEARNSFLVIDGQQRLLSLYYFLQLRFPKLSKRSELRRRLIEGRLSQSRSLLSDDEFFGSFKLSLPTDPGTSSNPLDGLDYDSLGDLKSQLDLRTMRVVIVKQAAPEGMESIFEIFNRLNTQGMNLAAQEIRMSLYHSDFMDMLAATNFDHRWRGIVGRDDADLHLRDVEFLLRGLALLGDGQNYSPSMVKFLNRYAATAEGFDPEQVEYLRSLLTAFFDACERLAAGAFHGQTGKFTVSIFDAVFVASTSSAYERGDLEVEPIDPSKLEALKADDEFIEATLSRTTGTGNVEKRLEKAAGYLGA